MTAACVSAAPVRRARADRDGRGPMTFVLAASVGEVLLRIVTAVVVAIVTTIIALRLLGGRRGWVTALLAGQPAGGEEDCGVGPIARRDLQRPGFVM